MNNHLLASHKFFILLLLLSFSKINFAQSTFQFGIGGGINYSDYSEDIDSKGELETPHIDKAVFLPSIQTRIAYVVDRNWSFSVSPTANWKGADQVFTMNNYRGIHLDIPILVHYQLFSKISIIAGPVYSRTVKFTVASLDNSSRNDSNLARVHNYAGKIGASYALAKHVEIDLTLNADIRETINFNFTNEDGKEIGNINLRNQFVQLAFILKT